MHSVDQKIERIEKKDKMVMLVTICRFSFEYPSMPDLLHLVYTRSSRNRAPPFGNPACAIP